MSRLFESDRLAYLKQFVGQHLGHHFRRALPVPFVDYSDAEKLRLVPLIFALMPRDAAIRPRYDMMVKPIIRRHLHLIGGPEHDDFLVDVLKVLCDNFDSTHPQRNRRRKFGIADLRAGYSQVHRRLLDNQNERCALCGSRFNQEVTETLDHILPWRLGGDVLDGANWRVLCEPCNRGKGATISSHVLPEYHNWAYGVRPESDTEHNADIFSAVGRFVALSNSRVCQHPSCGKGPRESQLHVELRIATGFTIFDHLTVLCDDHASAHVASHPSFISSEKPI